MIETDYDYSSDYHSGSIVEQDAKAFLGVYKRLEEVPKHHLLSNFAEDVDSEASWDAFMEATGVVEYSEHTQRYKYGKARRVWWDYCDRNGVVPALADPRDFEEHFTEEMDDMSTFKSGHDLRLRPLYLWYRWMVWNADYDHRYNPILMAVLFGGTTARLWKTRLYDRDSNPLWPGETEECDSDE